VKKVYEHNKNSHKSLKSIKWQVDWWAYFSRGRERRDRKQGEERLR
jgi:hypothetical protein